MTAEDVSAQCLGGHRPPLQRNRPNENKILVTRGKQKLIIYRAGRTPIEIVAVTQGARDIPIFLRRRIPLR